MFRGSKVLCETSRNFPSRFRRTPRKLFQSRRKAARPTPRSPSKEWVAACSRSRCAIVATPPRHLCGANWRDALGDPRLSEEIEKGDQNASGRGRSDPPETQTFEGGREMNDDDFELVHGSGNVFRDLGIANPEVEQLKAILAAKIIGILDDQKLTVRRAHELTGFAAADFSRVRQAKLSRFTVDRLM